MDQQQKLPHEDDYAISKEIPDRKIRVPAIPYKPPRTKGYRPRIGIIGCGGIMATHLQAYRKARYQVVAFADPLVQRASSIAIDFIVAPRSSRPPASCSIVPISMSSTLPRIQKFAGH